MDKAAETTGQILDAIKPQVDEMDKRANTTSEPTLKDLQAEAVSLGMPEEDVKSFTSKAPLQVTINALKAVKAEQKVASLEPVVNATEEKQVERQWENKADRMRAMLEKQPKVRILVPLEGQEKAGKVNWVVNPRHGMTEPVFISGAVQPVQINGCKWLIPKGVYVDVPEQIAQLIQDKYQQTADAGKEFLLDRIDPETGRSVREQLS